MTNNLEKLLCSPSAIPPDIIRELTVGDLERVENAVQAARKYLSGAEPLHYWFKMVEGGGKTHFLQFIHTEIASSSYGKAAVWISFQYEFNVISSSADFLAQLAERIGSHHPLETWTDLKNLLAHKHIRPIVLIEKPRRILGKHLAEIISQGIDAGLMFIFFSDSPPPDKCEKLILVEIPAYTIQQLGEILKKRGAPEKISKKAQSIFQLYGFVPRTPFIALSLSKIFLLAPELTAERALHLLLEEMSPRFSAKLDSLSPQQKKLVLTIAGADKMLTPGEIAEIASIEVPVVNAQFKRLRDSGWLHTLDYSDKNITLHCLPDSLFHYWIKQNTSHYEIPLFSLIRRWNEWKTIDYPPLKAFTAYIRKAHCIHPKPVDNVRFLTDPECLPSQSYEPLAKVVAGYLRGESCERGETIMENETERSLNLGQKGRAARAMLFTGMFRLRLGKFKAALTSFNSAENYGEKEPLLWINLGSLNFQNGNIEKARAYFTQSAQSTARYPHPFSGLGAVFRSLNILEKAERYFKQALEIDPQFPPALIGSANIHLMRDDLPEALDYFKQAVQSEPDNLIALTAAADIAFSLDLFDQCGEYCSQVLRVSENISSRTEAAKLSLAACAASTLNRTIDKNYGLAEKAFLKGLSQTSILKKDIQVDILTPYFFALASISDSNLWENSLGLCRDTGLSDLSGLLKLHEIALQLRDSPQKIRDVQRLFPQERRIFDEILQSLS
ncbi:MAG: tetratricopeptide repeat protein [candidate division Zixibacteria bacterium]|nr:tetratricopeptide repeat protein [Candidatus Tariuqbacter arcticus]